MDDLAEHHRALRLHRIGDAAERIDAGRVEAAHRLRPAERIGVHADGFEDDGADAAARAGAVIGEMLRARQMVLTEIRRVCGNEDAVAEAQGADVERA